MNPGLLYLLRKEPMGRLRRARRRFRGVKGVLLLLGLIAVVSFLIVPQVIVAASPRGAAEQAMLDGLTAWGPHALLLMAFLMSLSVGGLYFRPAEIAHLFPAPIPRRDLLLYNILSRMKIQLVSGLFVSIFITRWGAKWYGAVIACVLFLFFIQLSSQLSGLFFAILDERVAKPVRRFGALAIIGAIALMVARHSGFTTQPELDQIIAGLESVKGLPVIEQLAVITRPFVEVFTGPDVPHVLQWGAACAVVLAVQLALVMTLDVAFLESALATSRKVQRKLARARGGGGAMAAMGPSKARFSLPHPPKLGGAGALAWRQLTEVTRHPKPILMLAFMMGLFILPLTMIQSIGSDPSESTGSSDKAWILFPMLVFTTVLTMHLTFDFRRDVDRLAFLKALPLPPFGVACGQIIANTMLLTGLQLAVAVFLTARGLIQPVTLLALVPVLTLVNWVSVSVDNLLFLLMPHRIAIKDPGQFQFMGRLMLVTVLKMVVLFATFGVSAIPAVIAIKMFGGTQAMAALITVPGLALLALLFAWLVSRAFQRFDVSMDIPA